MQAPSSSLWPTLSMHWSHNGQAVSNDLIRDQDAIGQFLKRLMSVLCTYLILTCTAVGSDFNLHHKLMLQVETPEGIAREAMNASI